MYAKGMSTVDINSHLKKIYGFEVSPETVSRITDKILPIAKEWQNRPLENILKTRGIQDILIASVDGLNGFQEAIKSIYSKCEIQRCIVHQIRNSCKYVPWKDRKKFCSDMKKIYNAVNEEQALSALSEFSDIWSKKYPYAVKSWENNWDELMTFMKYPIEIRKLIYMDKRDWSL